jgi:hypothetical protein
VTVLHRSCETDRIRFGWVNASWVYALSFIPMHAKRALGALTPWETYEKATKIRLGGFEDGLIRENSHEGSDEITPADSEDDNTLESAISA